MNIKVNGQFYDLDNIETIAQLLRHFQVNQPSGIAVALNLNVVKRTDFEKAGIKEGDEIEIIRAVQGG
ncbi:sulfur carrier protein ThiS [bacterium]|nr:sulfur carrier protein ThiS [bacterium]